MQLGHVSIHDGVPVAAGPLWAQPDAGAVAATQVLAAIWAGLRGQGISERPLLWALGSFKGILTTCLYLVSGLQVFFIKRNIGSTLDRGVRTPNQPGYLYRRFLGCHIYVLCGGPGTVKHYLGSWPSRDGFMRADPKRKSFARNVQNIRSPPSRPA